MIEALLAGVALLLAPTAGDTRTDRWTALRSAPLERSEVAAARVGRFVYVVGGFEPNRTSPAVERYDIRRDRWKRVRDMPLAVNHPAAVAYGGDVYVHGGYTADLGLSGTTGALQRYDPERNRWTQLRSSPTPRAAQALAVVGHRLYSAGGANETGSLRSLEVYDFDTRRWSRRPDFPPPARNHTTGVSSGGRFYVLAGRDSENFTAAARYDPGRRKWQRLPPLHTARGGIASTRLSDGRIVVFGGEQLGTGGTTIGQVELFDPRTRRWTSLPDMRTPRHGLAGAAVGRRVFAIEGGPTPGFSYTRTIEYLDVPPR